MIEKLAHSYPAYQVPIHSFGLYRRGTKRLKCGMRLRMRVLVGSFSINNLSSRGNLDGGELILSSWLRPMNVENSEITDHKHSFLGNSFLKQDAMVIKNNHTRDFNYHFSVVTFYHNWNVSSDLPATLISQIERTSLRCKIELKRKYPT